MACARKRADFKTYGFLYFGYVFHVMDYTNSYGNVPFWPFSNRWYALDLVFIIDPWITGLLVASLLLMVFRVRSMPVVAVCFALLFSYWGLRYYTHSGAVRAAKEQVPEALKVGAFRRFEPVQMEGRCRD
jgi:membrane-bound metal-dependent hydrolase YbcI (DUF457 family)